MELRLPLEMSPGREAACRAVFGTWGFFPNDARKNCPFVLTSFTGWSSERCPGIGFLSRGDREIGPSPPPGDLPDPGIQPVSLLGLLHCRRVHRGSPSIKKAMYYTSPLPTNCSANARIFCREGNANASNHCHPPTIASLPGPLLAPCLD